MVFYCVVLGISAPLLGTYMCGYVVRGTIVDDSSDKLKTQQGVDERTRGPTGANREWGRYLIG
jgi:hypothetical protein